MAFEVKNLRKTYGKKVVVHDVSFCLEKSSILGLLGPNGAGKTTSFYMSIGLLDPDLGCGEIWIDGEKFSRMTLEKAVQMGVGYLQQDGSVFRDMTVEENILCGLESRDLGFNDQQKELKEILDEFGLFALKNEKAKLLSGGERRKLEIARLVACNLKYALLDEPFAGIDPVAISSIRQIIISLKNRGMGVLITDHNAKEVCVASDKMMIVMDGVCLASGPVDLVLRNEVVRERYLGLDFKIH